MPNTVSIQTVAKLIGLTPHAIRAWERRYGAIEPARSKGQHRMYSEADTQRLALLAEATRSGKSISRLAGLDNEKLRAIVREGAKQTRFNARRVQGGVPSAAELDIYTEALTAIERLDTQALDDAYQRTRLKLGDQGLLKRLICPLAREVGERWRAGRLNAAQEHFFTAISKAFVWNLSRQYHLDAHAPRIVVGTPAGQIHDLGAVLVAATAANTGWRVSYVGASLPAFELAGAVQTVGASVLALSIVYPEDDPSLGAEISLLGRLLPQGVHLFVGGRAAQAYLPELKEANACVLSSMDHLDLELDAIRKKQATP